MKKQPQPNKKSLQPPAREQPNSAPKTPLSSKDFPAINALATEINQNPMLRAVLAKAIKRTEEKAE